MFPATPTGVVGFGCRLSEEEYAKIASAEAENEQKEDNPGPSLSRRASSRLSRRISIRRKPIADMNLTVDTGLASDANEIYEQDDYTPDEGEYVDWEEYVAENTFVPNRENFLTDWNYVPDEEMPPVLRMLMGPQTVHLEDPPEAAGEKSGEQDEDDDEHESDEGDESGSNYDSDSSGPSLLAQGSDSPNTRFPWNSGTTMESRLWPHNDPYEPAFMKRIRQHYDPESAESGASEVAEGYGHTEADNDEDHDPDSQGTSTSPSTQIADNKAISSPEDSSDPSAVSFLSDENDEDGEDEARETREPYTDFELDCYLGHVERTSDREYEVEERRFKTLEDAALRLQAESKGYLDSLRGMCFFFPRSSRGFLPHR